MTSRRGERLRILVVQLARFGVVGAAGLGVDVVVFNVLRLGIMSPESFHEGPIVAKVISTSLAILTNWIGNRYWTFADTRQRSTVREAAEFFAVSAVGMLIGLACLWVSHYVLGFTSVIADNIASNVIGLALGAVFRFSLYRWWVFNPHRSGTRNGALAPATQPKRIVPPDGS